MQDCQSRGLIRMDLNPMLAVLFEKHDNMSSNRRFEEEMEEITNRQKVMSKIMKIFDDVGC